MKNFIRQASAPMLVSAFALIAGRSARADTITAPLSAPTYYTSFSGNTSQSDARWYVGCDYEFACDSYYTTGQNTISNDVEDFYTPTGILNVTAVPGADLAFQEVDSYDPFDAGNYDTPYEYVVFDAAYSAAPMTFTFGDLSDNPVTVAGFATTLYENNPFTGNVSAFNSQGQLIGSLAFSSVEDPLQEYFGYQSYSAVVGALDSNWVGLPNIASVVVSTSDDSFAFGTVALDEVPEPGTFGLIGIGVLAIAAANRKSRVSPRPYTASLR